MIAIYTLMRSLRLSAFAVNILSKKPLRLSAFAVNILSKKPLRLSAFAVNYLRMKTLIFLLIFTLPVTLQAQTITISGNAQKRVFEKVRIKVYADQFSHLKKTIAETLTDEKGNFSLSFDYSKTNYAYLSVELLEGEFYLVPGADYQFNVLPDTAQKGSVYDQLPLQFTIKIDDGGLNNNLMRYNAMYNSFVLNHFNQIYRSRSLVVIEDFRKTVNQTFAGFNNTYFDNYVKYSLAQLIWVSKKKSTKTIVSEYFAGKPVLFNNIQYTDFFRDIFKEYVVATFYAKHYNGLVEAVFKGSLNDMEHIFMQDELLAGDTQLRELVLMQTIAGFYRNPDFSAKGVLQILKQMEKSGKTKEVRSIASNYITRLKHLSYGTPAPDFNLPVSSGKTYSPADFKGRVTILDFMKTDCKVCLAHFDFLKDMSSRMGSKLRIVVLVYGDHPEKIKQLLRQEGLDWTVLYVGKRTDILDEYDVKIFPTYVLLKPDASIGLAPASMADENLENEVLRLLQKK